MAHDRERSGGLTPREKELTALGAAIASNCIPCIEYHIPQARRVGWSESQIREAVELADQVRRVPAGKVLQTALALLDVPATTAEKTGTERCDCDAPQKERATLETHTPAEDNEEGEGSCCGAADPEDSSP